MSLAQYYNALSNSQEAIPQTCTVWILIGLRKHYIFLFTLQRIAGISTCLCIFAMLFLGKMYVDFGLAEGVWQLTKYHDQ